jgi:protein-L-isoaspartate(D-aspartate) O-methyltransferase
MTLDEERYIRDRERMVDEQILARDIDDPRVLQAMRRVPRHMFVPPDHRHLAYADCPLPIGQNQTISQPYIVALMTQMLDLVGHEKVLEIGTGSGYQAAVLSLLAKEVVTVERHPRLMIEAKQTLSELGVENVHVHLGDGTQGWPEDAPYDAIITTAAAPRAPQPLLDQLAEGGRLVIPVGSRGGQFLERWLRLGDRFESEQGVPVAFVPLVGEHGWKEDSWDWM